MQKRISYSLLAIACLELAAGNVSAKSHEKKHRSKDGGEKVKWENVPAPARATIEKNASGAKVADIARKTKDGASVYLAKFKGADHKINKLTVSGDGKLINLKKEEETRHKHWSLFGNKSSNEKTPSPQR